MRHYACLALPVMRDEIVRALTDNAGPRARAPWQDVALPLWEKALVHARFSPEWLRAGENFAVVARWGTNTGLSAYRTGTLVDQWDALVGSLPATDYNRAIARNDEAAVWLGKCISDENTMVVPWDQGRLCSERVLEDWRAEFKREVAKGNILLDYGPFPREGSWNNFSKMARHFIVWVNDHYGGRQGSLEHLYVRWRRAYAGGFCRHHPIDDSWVCYDIGTKWYDPNTPEGMRARELYSGAP